MRIATSDVGLPLNSLTSLREFLCVMYDACAVQRNMYRKAKVLHRDISDNNIMVAPPAENTEFYEHCAEGYDEVKYINQVLANDKRVRPKPTCLVIDLGNGADLGLVHGQEALTMRTGTPKFIARSMSSGMVLGAYLSRWPASIMPKLEGRELQLYKYHYGKEYEKYNRTVGEGSRLDKQLFQAKSTHQLFHDSESVFWVIAWTLVCATRDPSQKEANPTIQFKKFAYAMLNHLPGDLVPDRRATFHPDETNWGAILHNDLADMVPMVSQMHSYIWYEWAYKDALEPEHSHEALMRLLLQEIVRIDNTSDMSLKFGSRPLPVDLGHQQN
ncbi:hypothetical protein CTheo_6715 [Ceratobasidium theobromae]|uniref:Fungal-type protein kinase domain-containing protein n=1 Tax=Ceratobasidium theobromae TaxID=1582974 RepID=A0A5N5QDM9_9AGAM|nr:hypothetical protein CTheo_6715 [Ceratobasidium theobromae]